MLQRWRHGRRCRKLAKSCSEPVLRDYLEACAELAVGHLGNTPLIAADLELTGLNRRCDQIIAIGWTLIDNGRIQFSGNRHIVIRADLSVGSSAAIHEMLDSDVAQGDELPDALQALFAAARGRVWVMHHAGLDIGFLKAACAHCMGTVPGFIVLDTLRIEHRQRVRSGMPVKDGDLQLGRLRRAYGLPRYAGHDALTDAIATAELLLAIAAACEPRASLELSPQVRYF